MENPNEQNSSGLTTRGLRAWGLLFLTLGAVGRGIFQTRLLGIGALSGQELLELMSGGESAMLYATFALLLEAVQTCAIPIFAALLLDGVQHTSSFLRYALRVAGLAVVTEIPYNFALSGKLVDLSGRNPVFGLLIGLIMLYLYRSFEETSLQHRVIKLVVFAAALFWAAVLKIQFAPCLIFVLTVLWALREKPVYRNIAGTTAVVICTLLSPFYLAGAMGFLVVHFYHGEQGEENRLASYLAYPVLLLAVGLLVRFLL